MNAFSVVAAVCGHRIGKVAETAANVEVYVNQSDAAPSLSLNAPLVIERFGTSALFRIVALRYEDNNSPLRNMMVLCLPTDCAWDVSKLRKIKSKNSGKKAIQFDVWTQVGNKEGFDKLAITIPFDGNDGNAMLYYQAMLFASQEVIRILRPAVNNS
jgi:hypothetical protein